MIPEEEHGSWGWSHEPQGHYFCHVCNKVDTFDHDIVIEKDIAGTVMLSYCTYSGAVIDEPARDITQAELAYVKKSLGVT